MAEHPRILESNFEATRCSLGVADCPGVTTLMLSGIRRKGIKSIEDLAGSPPVISTEPIFDRRFESAHNFSLRLLGSLHRGVNK